MKRSLMLLFLIAGIAYPSANANAQVAPPYVLEVGDTLEVSYTYTPEYNQSVTITSDGTVTLTRVGMVRISGLTTAAATNVIIKAASGSGLNHPDVFITLKDYVKPQFTVLGEVNKPGRYELHGTVGVADGLATAGGLNLSARLKYIILIHRISATEGETTLINYKTLERKNAEITLQTLQDGDILVVPLGNISKIERVIKLANIGAYYPI